MKTRFMNETDGNYPSDVLQMYPENEPAMKRNVGILNDSPGKLCTIKATDKISDNRKYPLALIHAAQNQKQTNAGGLANLLQLKIGAKVLLAVDINIQDRLINGQT